MFLRCLRLNEALLLRLVMCSVVLAPIGLAHAAVPVPGSAPAAINTPVKSATVQTPVKPAATIVKPAAPVNVLPSADNNMVLRTSVLKPTATKSPLPVTGSRSVPVAPSTGSLNAKLLTPSPLPVLKPQNSGATASTPTNAKPEPVNAWPIKPKLAPLSVKVLPTPLASAANNTVSLPKATLPSTTIASMAAPQLASPVPTPYNVATPLPIPSTTPSPTPFSSQRLEPLQPSKAPVQTFTNQAFTPNPNYEPLRAVSVPALKTAPPQEAAVNKPLSFWQRLTSRFHHGKQSAQAKPVTIASTALMSQPLSPVPPLGGPAQSQQRLTGLAMAFGSSAALPYIKPVYTPSMVFGAMKQPQVTEASRIELTRFIAKTNRNLAPYQQEGIANGILEMSRQQGVDYRLVASLLAVESSFRTEAISSTGAIGLGQLKDVTARWLQVSDPFDPVDNLTGVSKYLKYLVGMFPGEVEKAVASYYMGQGNVQRQGLNEAGWGYVRKVDLAYQNLLDS